MPAGDARAAYGEMLRAKAGLEPHDPGDPGDHLDPKVSRCVYDLIAAGVTDQSEAIRELAAREGAGLNPGQIATVLRQFAAPPDPDDDPTVGS